MLTAEEIRAKSKALHDEISASYYSGTSGLSKEQFDLQHGKIWNDMEADLITEGYKKTPKPPRDLEAEIDTLKVKVSDLGKK